MISKRNDAIVLALLLLGAAAVAVVLARPDPDERSPGPDALPPIETTDQSGEAPAAAPRSSAMPAARPRVAGAADEIRGDAPLQPAATHGFLDVRIQLPASLVGRFVTGHLEVAELINPGSGEVAEPRRPWVKRFGVRPGRFESPVYVEAGPVPFSEYGYRVALIAPGFNGSSQVVRLNATNWNPQVELSVTPPSALALRVVDQRMHPWVETPAMLVPIGEPAGRPVVDGETNNFGTAIYEQVLAGDYELRIGANGEAKTKVQVERPGFVRDDLEFGAQSLQVTIPRGQSLIVEVFDTFQRGLPNVRVVVSAVDTVENRRHELQTAANGIATFEHVLPGTYSISVSAPGFQHTGKGRVPVPDDGPPTSVQFRMVRLR